MKNPILYLLASFLIFLSSCEEGGLYSGSPFASDASESADSGEEGEVTDSGILTAAEWNDLDNWNFWENLIQSEPYSETQDHWEFYPVNRISLSIFGQGTPLVDAKVELLKNGELVWAGKSDNSGSVELWPELFVGTLIESTTGYTLRINGQLLEEEFSLGTTSNEIECNLLPLEHNRVEIAYIVDGTGSMGDELDFLKEDLEDVINRVSLYNSQLDILTASVFYRDKGDKYLVKKSGFTRELNTTLEFIQEQEAGGGGDFPEAVEEGLSTAIEELQWSAQARTRIAFLILDAPPHHKTEVLTKLHQTVELAAKKGIKIIPITASGINKQTEFLMRFMAISTNGTYVFITNDSGIGNDHLQASVGSYEVEFLNDLMVRLIRKYSN